jgi:Flp pilus assembly protein TadG
MAKHGEAAAASQTTASGDKPEGAISAAILASGIGAAALGVVTVLAEASTTVKDLLQWSAAVGPLSGKTTVAVLVWALSWAVLHAVLRNRPTETSRALTIALVLIGLGVVGTFPTFFQLFAAE